MAAVGPGSAAPAGQSGAAGPSGTTGTSDTAGPSGTTGTGQPATAAAGPAITGFPAGDAVATLGRGIPIDTFGAGDPLGAVSAGTTVPAHAQQPGRTPGPAVTTHTTGGTVTAGTPGPAIAQQPSAGPPDTTGRAGPAGPAGPAGADQPGGPAGPAGLAGRTRTTGPAVTPQDSAGPAGLAGAGRPGGPITDQRAPQQRLGGRINRVQHGLLQRRQRGGVGRLRADIRAGRGVKCLHKPVLKRRDLRADRLILPSMATKQCRDRRRHLIGARGQHAGGRPRRRRIGRTDRRPDARHI